MTELVPVGQVEPTTPSMVAMLRAEVMALDEARKELAEAGDVDTLALGLVQLRQIIGDLRMLTQATEDDVARLMPAKTHTVPGVGTLERRKGSIRKQWDSEALVRRLVAQALVDADGSPRYDDPMTAGWAVADVLTECAPFTASTGWRATGLRGRDVDPDDYCESKPGRVTVQVHGEQEQT